MRLVAVIPSISVDRLGSLRRMSERLSKAGVHAIVVSNARSLSASLAGTELDYLATGNNAGFAASVNVGMRGRDFDWVVILNDDLDLAEEASSQLVAALSKYRDSALVYFDAESPRPFPGPRDVIGNLSLVGSLMRAVRGRERANSGPRPGHPEMPRGHYKSFSAVAIRGDVVEDVGALDESIPFTFEDADYARRVQNAGYKASQAPLDGFTHEHSASTTRWIKDVLPVSVWSAYRYSSKWLMPDMAARVLCTAALLPRVLASLRMKADTASHVIGIGRAVIALWARQQPVLPSYDEL